MLLLREAHVLQLLPMKDAIGAMRETFQAVAEGRARNQARRRLATRSGAMLHTLAGAGHGYFGTKVYSTHPRHGAHFLVLLYREETGEPVAVIEANHLGQIRTGAASGLATDLLANPDAATLAVIGSGFQALTQVQAIAEVRPLQDVRVWSRDAERRRRFATQCALHFGVPARACASARECVSGADVIATATYSKDPVLEGAWIGEGVHINAVGSNNPQRRELPAETIGRASLIAVDSREQARMESGDLLLAWDDADWNSPRLVELQDVVTGRAGRQSSGDLTIFKSNGLGIEDVAAAALVYERARAQGVGDEVSLMGL